MADGAYKFGMAEIWRGNVDFLANDIKACWVNTTGAGTLYTANLATDQHLSDIPAGAIAATSANLTSKTISDAGVVDAADFSFASVPAGNANEAIVIYQDTGVGTTSVLIAYYDTGVTATPDGNNVSVTVNASGLLTL